MKNITIRSTLVSTNSMAQGEAVANLWKSLFESGMHIDFRIINSIGIVKPKLMCMCCVIIGFSTAPNQKPKILFLSDKPRIVENINGYLLDAENIFVGSRSIFICDVLKIGIGYKPIDGEFYLFEKDEMEQFLKKESAAKKYFKHWYGSYESINCCPRYCLSLEFGNLTKWGKCLNV